MRKEVVLAIIAGSILGLVIAFGIWRANSFLGNSNKNKAENNSPTQAPQPQSVDLALASPENQEVVIASKVLVKGITKPNSYVVLVGEEKDIQTTSDSQGAFEKEANLIPGINNLKVFSFDPADGSTVKNLTLVYSSEFAKFLDESKKTDGATPNPSSTANPSASPKASTSPAGDVVREKVMEKVAAAGKKATAYIGTITDFAAGTIQIKNEAGEILQASFDTKVTEFVKVTETETKKIEEADVAIGDFVAVMGFVTKNETTNGNGGVLSAMRVLVTTKPVANETTAVLGTVEKVDKKNVSLKTNDSTSITAIFGKKWDGPELKEVKEGDKIIVVGIKKDSSFEVRTLILIKGATPAPNPSITPSAKPSPSPVASPIAPQP